MLQRFVTQALHCQEQGFGFVLHLTARREKTNDRHENSSYTGQQHGDIATLTCDSGFALAGPGFWTCLVSGRNNVLPETWQLARMEKTNSDMDIYIYILYKN